MARLSLSFLGAFRATLDGTTLSGFRSNKVRALLAYLSVETTRPHSRQSLAGLLWPELSDQAAGAALRNALSNLRRLLTDLPFKDTQPFLLVTRNTIQFNPSSDYWLDVQELNNQLSAVNNPHSAIGTLRKAVDLYQGDFLAGFFVADSIPFEEWLLLRSEDYHSRMITAMQQLAGLLIEQGDYLQAQQIARQQLELEPYSETGYRQLIRSLASSGQRSEALLQFNTLRRLLADDLEAYPEPETIALYETIRSRTTAGARSLKPDLLHEIPARPHFVARESQIRVLDNYLTEAMSCQGKVAFISGEPGSGKTTLLAKFSQSAMQRYPNLVAAFGSCTARNGLCSPYLPFVDILSMLSGDIESQQAGVVDHDHAQRLWELWPDVIRALMENGPGLIGTLLPIGPLKARVEAFALPGLSLRNDLDRLTDRALSSTAYTQLDIFVQVTSVLFELARRTPLLLVIDDLQWADASSLSLLFHLGRRLSGHPIFILCAYRSTELEPPSARVKDRHSLNGIVNEFQRDFGDPPIDLDQADGRAFVEAFLDSEPNRLGKDFRQTLYLQTGGNPLFTVELLRSMQERQQLLCNSKGEKVAIQDLDWAELPARVEGVIAERVRCLPDLQRRLLEAASIEGEVFTAEVVARLVAIPEDEARQQLSNTIARRARLVRAESVQRIGARRVSNFRFRHILYQKYIHGRLDPIERSEMHLKAAEALEALFMGNESQKNELTSPTIGRQAQLAWHFEQAGLIERAVDYLLQAGNQAVQLSAHSEAIDFYRRGLELISSLPETKERDQQELTLQMNLFVPLMGIYGWSAPEQTQVYDRMGELSRRIGADIKDDQFFRLLTAQTVHYYAMGKCHEAAALGEQLLSHANKSRNPADKVIASWILGQAYTFCGELESADCCLRQALESYDPGLLGPMIAFTGLDLEASVRGFQIVVWWLQGYQQRAYLAGQDLLKYAQMLTHPMSQYYTVVNVISFLSFIVNGSLKDLWLPQTPVRPVEQESFRSENDLAFFHLYAETLQGFIQVEKGELEKGIARMQSSIAGLSLTGTHIGRPFLLYLLAIAHLKAGLPEKALEIVDELLVPLEKSGGHFFLAGFYLLRGEILLHLTLAKSERDPEAENCFIKAIEVARRQGAKSWELKAATNLARCWQTQEKIKEAYQMLAKIYGWFSDGFDMPDLVKARSVLAELAKG